MVARDSHPDVARLQNIDVLELLICFTLSVQWLFSSLRLLFYCDISLQVDKCYLLVLFQRT
jgi:hypothetical protein